MRPIKYNELQNLTYDLWAGHHDLMTFFYKNLPMLDYL